MSRFVPLAALAALACATLVACNDGNGGRGGAGGGGPGGVGSGGVGGRLPDEETVGPITHGNGCRGRDYPGNGATGGALRCPPSYTYIDLAQPLVKAGQYRATVKVGARQFECPVTLPVPCASPIPTCSENGSNAFEPLLSWSKSKTCVDPSATLAGFILSSDVFEELRAGQGQALPASLDVTLVHDGGVVVTGAFPLKFSCQHFGHCAAVRGDRVTIPLAAP